jgi:hypothetical protein
MSFDWSEYLIVAKELASQATTSTKTRNKIKVILLNVINRAFSKARNHLRDIDGHPSKSLEQGGRTHQIVIDLFSQSNDIDRRLIAQSLKDLRSARNKADYDDVVPHLSGLTMTVLLQSEQVLNLLKTL